jgi:uncharacterized repeat protein (TIGR03803 family)
MLAGCGGSQQTMNVAPFSSSHTSVTYSVLYSFKGGSDGQYPTGSLLNVNGTLYGTTLFGGFKNRSRISLGTVFALTTSGAESVIHRFMGAHHDDGANPRANLIDVNGTLYSTTWRGGTHQVGAVFEITPSGGENLLYSFRGQSAADGDAPTAGLVSVGGTFYGTTELGGKAACYSGEGCGTVYSVATNGTEKVLHRFGGGPADGADPYAGLIHVDGTLYGTSGGGAHGEGTVFAITTSGKEHVLHSFAGGPADGAGPSGSLINVNGTLYGNTFSGGTKNAGTVFSITRTGKETVLYSFQFNGDGRNPQGALTYVNGKLYGTTTGTNSYKNGTVFGLTMNGKLTVLHTFSKSTDGSDPQAGVIYVNGTLYGTTARGGANGAGTVFAITP